MSWLLHKLEQYKDAILAIAALASPFLAVFAAVFAARRSAAATIAAADKQRETSLDVAERNTRITVRATNRQKWIDELRQEVAEFISLLPSAHGIRRNDPTFDRPGVQ
jgi:predicted membrane metal-binding protein